MLDILCGDTWKSGLVLIRNKQREGMKEIKGEGAKRGKGGSDGSLTIKGSDEGTRWQ